MTEEASLQNFKVLLDSVGPACVAMAKMLEELQRGEISPRDASDESTKFEMLIKVLIGSEQDILTRTIQRRGTVQDIYTDVTEALTLLGRIGGGGDVLTEQLCSLLERLEEAATQLHYPLAGCLNSLLDTMTSCNNGKLLATLMQALAPMLTRGMAMILMDQNSMFGSFTAKPLAEIMNGDGSERLGLEDLYKWECVLDKNIRQHANLQDSGTKIGFLATLLQSNILKTMSELTCSMMRDPDLRKHFGKEARRWVALLSKQFSKEHGLPAEIRFSYLLGIVDLCIYAHKDTQPFTGLEVLQPESIWKEMEGTNSGASPMLRVTEALLAKIEKFDSSQAATNGNDNITSFTCILQFVLDAYPAWSVYSTRWALHMICRLSKPIAKVLQVGRACSLMPQLRDAFEIVSGNIHSDCCQLHLYHMYTVDVHRQMSQFPIKDLEISLLIDLVNSYHSGNQNKLMAECAVLCFTTALDCANLEMNLQTHKNASEEVKTRNAEILAKYLIEKTHGNYAEVFCSLFNGHTFINLEGGVLADPPKLPPDVSRWVTHYWRLSHWGYMPAHHMEKGLMHVTEQLSRLLASNPAKKPKHQRLWLKYSSAALWLVVCCTTLVKAISKASSGTPAVRVTAQKLEAIVSILEGCDGWKCLDPKADETRDLLSLRRGAVGFLATLDERSEPARKSRNRPSRKDQQSVAQEEVNDNEEGVSQEGGEGCQTGSSSGKFGGAGLSLGAVAVRGGRSQYPPKGERQHRGKHSIVQ